MKQVIKLIKENVFPLLGVATPDVEHDISKKFYFFTTIMVTLIFSLFTLLYLFQGAYKVAALQGLIVGVCLLSWSIFKKTKSTNLAGSFLLLFGATSGFLRTYWMGGFTAPSLYIWPIIPLFTAAAMSIRYALFWTFVYIGMAIYFYVAHINGIVFESKLSADSLNSIRIIGIVTVQLLVLTVINYIRSVNRKYRQIIAQQTEEKTNLVRILFHDVATPITILKTSLGRLEKQLAENPGISTDVKRMSRSLHALGNILDHVKELEAVSSGKKPLKFEKVNVLEIFNELKELHHYAFEQKNIQFSIEPRNEGGNFLVFADRKGLCYQVLNNLMSNAIKFTDSGGAITVIVESHPNLTRCSIKDTGIGMPDEILKNLFQASIRTTRPGTSGEEGTGFGMPIVKNYIEKFNGKIEVRSILKTDDAHDHGTTVTVILPNVA